MAFSERVPQLSNGMHPSHVIEIILSLTKTFILPHTHTGNIYARIPIFINENINNIYVVHAFLIIKYFNQLTN